jgi:hypothetical protein
MRKSNIAEDMLKNLKAQEQYKIKVAKKCCDCKDCGKGCDCEDCGKSCKGCGELGKKKSAMSEIFSAMAKIADLQDQFGFEGSSQLTTMAMEVMAKELSKVAWDDENEVIDWDDVTRGLSEDEMTQMRNEYKLHPEVMKHLRHRLTESQRLHGGNKLLRKEPVSIDDIFQPKEESLSVVPDEEELVGRPFPQQTPTTNLYYLLNPSLPKSLNEEPEFDQEEGTVRPGRPPTKEPKRWGDVVLFGGDEDPQEGTVGPDEETLLPSEDKVAGIIHSINKFAHLCNECGEEYEEDPSDVELQHNHYHSDDIMDRLQRSEGDPNELGFGPLPNHEFPDEGPGLNQVELEDEAPEDHIYLLNNRTLHKSTPEENKLFPEHSLRQQYLDYCSGLDEGDAPSYKHFLKSLNDEVLIPGRERRLESDENDAKGPTDLIHDPGLNKGKEWQFKEMRKAPIPNIPIDENKKYNSIEEVVREGRRVRAKMMLVDKIMEHYIDLNPSATADDLVEAVVDRIDSANEGGGSLTLPFSAEELKEMAQKFVPSTLERSIQPTVRKRKVKVDEGDADDYPLGSDDDSSIDEFDLDVAKHWMMKALQQDGEMDPRALAALAAEALEMMNPLTGLPPDELIALADILVEQLQPLEFEEETE